MQQLLRRSAFLICGLALGSSMLALGSLLGAMLAWAFCLILAALSIRRPASPLELFIAGMGGYASGTCWVYHVIADYAGVGPLFSGVLFALYAAVGALQFALVSVLYRFFDRRFLGSSASLPCAWVAVELFFPRFIPWTLGQTQLAPAPLAQIADIFGVSLISGLMLWWSIIVVKSITAPRRFMFAPLAAAVASIIAVVCYGAFRSIDVEEAAKSAAKLRVALVQADLNPFTDFKPEKLQAVAGRYRDLSFGPVTKAPLDLLIWPESSIWESYAPDIERLVPGAPGDPFPGLAVPLLFGGQSALNISPRGKSKLFNSLFLLRADREFSGRYHKQILVPFGEKIPLREFFPVVEQLSQKNYFVAPGPPGQEPIKLALERLKTTAVLGSAICYEDLFPEVLLEQVQRGATLLVALSNDAWFLGTPAAAMHHSLSVWRAIELRRYLIRATVDGFTGIIDPLGRTVAALEPHTADVLVSDAPGLLDTRSLYSRWGDAPLKLFAAMIFLAAASIRKTGDCKEGNA